MTELPKAPGAVIMTPAGNYWVEETAKEVSDKLEDAKGGINVDDGLVGFVGLESTGKSGPEGLISYVLRLSPLYIIGVRSMSQLAFAGAIAQAEQAARMQETAQGIFSMGAHLMEHPMAMGRRVTPELDSDEECCCGHPVKRHDLSGELVGACFDERCDCPTFHTHPEGGADHG